MEPEIAVILHEPAGTVTVKTLGADGHGVFVELGGHPALAAVVNGSSGNQNWMLIR